MIPVIFLLGAALCGYGAWRLRFPKLVDCPRCQGLGTQDYTTALLAESTIEVPCFTCDGWGRVLA